MDVMQIMLHLNQYLGTLIAQNGSLAYAVLFLVVFCEMGLLPLFFLPGDPLLFVSGAFCATGSLSLWIVVPLLFIAAALGSMLNYWMGRAVGQKVYSHNYRWLDRDSLKKSHDFYEKYGNVTFLMSPFIAVVRTFAPFVGGVASMAFPKFLVCMTSGAAVWVISLVVGGYFFGNIPVIRDHVGAIVLVGLGLGLGSLALSAVVKAYRARA
ncbi:MAG TPA: VTT domain-containing protein [Methylophilaceae bacterium]|jgi:membrane-associated protein